MDILDIAELRGGMPECCDFCKQPYSETRLPEPEEAGQWACTDCVNRWREKDHRLKLFRYMNRKESRGL